MLNQIINKKQRRLVGAGPEAGRFKAAGIVLF